MIKTSSVVTFLYYTGLNKKLELMLMKRARAHSSSCLSNFGLSLSMSSQFTLLQPKI